MRLCPSAVVVPHRAQRSSLLSTRNACSTTVNCVYVSQKPCTDQPRWLLCSKSAPSRASAALNFTTFHDQLSSARLALLTVIVTKRRALDIDL